MAHRAGRREEGRAKLLAGIGRGFRRSGYGGLGVDGLAKEAGVTSGAFYAHFRSKAEAFNAAVVAGMEDLEAAIHDLQVREGTGWPEAFIAFYLGERRICDAGESCALQSLSGDVARADDPMRDAYAAVLVRVIDAVASGLPPGGTEAERRDRATALLALLSGGVTMARAVRDPGLSDAIAGSVAIAARRLIA